MIEAKTVVINAMEDNRIRAGFPMSGVLLEVAAGAAKIAVMRMTRGHSEGKLAGHEVVVTVKLQPVGTAAEECKHEWTKSLNEGGGELCFDCGSVKR